MKQKIERRSPLKERPLHYAGQSLDDQIKKQFEDLSIWYWSIVILIICTVELWLQLLTPTAKPWLSTVVAVVLAIYGSIRIYRIRRNIVQLRLGRDGEKIVAETLDVLKQEGDVILHDIVADKFNLDHVVCSKHGIFVIETKTRSKPARGNPTVVFDGKRILVDGMESERDPVNQAMALACWLEQTVLDSTGKRFPVKPVIVFPGWFVETIVKGAPVWVLNPKALVSFVRNSPVTIPDSDLHLVVFHLTRYIRTQE